MIYLPWWEIVIHQTLRKDLGSSHYVLALPSTAAQGQVGTRDIGIEARDWGLFSEAVAVCRGLGTHLRKLHSAGTKVFAISMESRNPFHPIESSR